jgi:hypothetical protein
MKTSFLFISFLLLFFYGLFGCKKDYSQEGGEPISSVNCINCTYLPLCDSSKFVYIDSVAGVVDTTRNEMFILGDTLINSKKFYKVSPLAAFNQGLFYNCDNQEYKLLISLSAFGVNTDSLKRVMLELIQLPFPVPPELINIPDKQIITVLKANAAVSATWTDTIASAGIPFVYSAFVGMQHKFIAKNIQRTVLQKTYNDVIHVQSKPVASIPGADFPVDYQVDFYFAKDVGIIEMEVRNAQVIQSNSKLLEFKIK